MTFYFLSVIFRDNTMYLFSAQLELKRNGGKYAKAVTKQKKTCSGDMKRSQFHMQPEVPSSKYPDKSFQN